MAAQQRLQGTRRKRSRGEASRELGAPGGGCMAGEAALSQPAGAPRGGPSHQEAHWLQQVPDLQGQSKPEELPQVLLPGGTQIGVTSGGRP